VANSTVRFLTDKSGDVISDSAFSQLGIQRIVKAIADQRNRQYSDKYCQPGIHDRESLLEDIRSIVTHNRTPTHDVGVAQAEETEARLKQNRETDQQRSLDDDRWERIRQYDPEDQVQILRTA